MNTLRRLWCRLRGHPYPLYYSPTFEAWLQEDDPFYPMAYCTNCTAHIR